MTEKLKEIFETIDLIKYAGAETGTEIINKGLNVATDYVNSTKAVDETIAMISTAQRRVKIFFFALIFAGFSCFETGTASVFVSIFVSFFDSSFVWVSVVFFSTGFFVIVSSESKSGNESKIFPP